MSYKGDNSPEMDYFELRRRHDEFKRRQAKEAPAPQPDPREARPAAEAPAKPEPRPAVPVRDAETAKPEPAPEPVAAPVEDVPAAEPETVPAAAPEAEPAPAADLPEDAVPTDEAFEGEQDAGDEEEWSEGEGDFMSDEAEENPNPFSSFINVFNGIRSRLSSRRAKADEDEEYYGDEDDDPDAPDEAAETEAPVPEGEEAAAGEGFDEEGFDEEYADGEDLPEEEAAPKKRFFSLSFLRRKKDDEPYVDFDDSDYADEDYVEETFPQDDGTDSADEEPEVKPADEPAEAPAAETVEEPAAAAGDVEDIEDLPYDEPAISRSTAPAYTVQTDDGFDDDGFDDGFDDEDYEENPDEEDYEEDDDDADEPDGKSGFKRFLSLFIVRDDEEADEAPADDWEDEEDDWQQDEATVSDWQDEEEEDGEPEPVRKGFFLRPFRRAAALPEADAAEESEPEASEPYVPADVPSADADHSEGGSEMDEKYKLNIEMTEQMAAGLESRGMTRRERRELAERLAAEEAARRAEEEAARAAEQPEEEPLVADTVESISEGIVEIQETVVEEAPAEAEEVRPVVTPDPVVDEPTREFKPISKQAAGQPAQDSIFDLDEEEEDEDEEEEAPAGKRRFSLFGKKNRREEIEEDEDEDDEYDDEDEDEEEEEPKPRRGLFGKKSRKYEEEEDDEDDEYDDEDEDEDDEYDEYDEYDDDDEDDEYDDEDEDDDDDDQPFGRPLIGFFKVLFGFILVVLIAVFALNFLDYFNTVSLDPVFERYYNKMPGVLDTLFPSHQLKRAVVEEETEGLTAIDPLDDAADAAATAAPAVTQAPVATEPPAATEAPAAGGEAGSEPAANSVG